MEPFSVTIEISNDQQIKLSTSKLVKPQIVAALMLDVIKIMMFNGVNEEDSTPKILIAQPGDIKKVQDGEKIVRRKNK